MAESSSNIEYFWHFMTRYFQEERDDNHYHDAEPEFNSEIRRMNDIQQTRTSDKAKEGSLPDDHVILVSPSELILKSQYVRKTLQKSLLKDIAWKLSRTHENEAKIKVENGRIVVSNLKNPTNATKMCAEVFGVSVTCDAVRLPSENQLRIQAITRFARNELTSIDTFAVRARVIGTHSFHSKDIEAAAGKDILANMHPHPIRVDLDNPGRTVFVEIREEHSYAYSERNRGVGGIPYGTQGRLACLLSGGIDSPVAAWLMMKRGVHVIPIFMDMGNLASEDYKNKAIRVARHLREFAPVGVFKLSIAPFEAIARTIANITERRYTCVLCKRMMYRIACLFAQQKHALGVITGESVGQVASQTLQNMTTLSQAATLPIHRPLVGMDKGEIQLLATKIGTYEYSILKVKGCSLVPSKPATQASIETINKIEQQLDVNALSTSAVAEIQDIAID